MKEIMLFLILHADDSVDKKLESLLLFIENKHNNFLCKHVYEYVKELVFLAAKEVVVMSGYSSKDKMTMLIDLNKDQENIIEEIMDFLIPYYDETFETQNYQDDEQTISKPKLIQNIKNLKAAKNYDISDMRQIRGIFFPNIYIDEYLP